jgi:hypothetical protein
MMSEVAMAGQADPKRPIDTATAAEHLTRAQALLKSLESKIGQHPELGQAILKIETALNVLGVQTGAML